MVYKIKLKNSPEYALVSDEAYEQITKNERLKAIGFLENLRMHSNGYAFFQKNHPLKKGGYRNETIYLHRYIAERFVSKPASEKKLYVSIQNGNKLDCRVENLEWVPRSIAVRNTRKMFNSTGYRGVGKERNKYRAVLYQGNQKYDLGFFDTAEEAADAYNKKSEELFGKTRSLNNIGSPKQKYDAIAEKRHIIEQRRKREKQKKMRNKLKAKGKSKASN